MKRVHPLRVDDYLQHMLDAMARARRYVKEVPDVAAFERNALLQDATVRCIAIIGEAATKIQKADPAFTAAHPEIPWQQISGMRHRIVHDYFEIDFEIVWRTVEVDFPVLSQSLEAVKRIRRP